MSWSTVPALKTFCEEKKLLVAGKKNKANYISVIANSDLPIPPSWPDAPPIESSSSDDNESDEELEPLSKRQKHDNRKADPKKPPKPEHPGTAPLDAAPASTQQQLLSSVLALLQRQTDQPNSGNVLANLARSRQSDPGGADGQTKVVLNVIFN